MAIITGDETNNLLDGGADPDTLSGLGGDDILSGAGGNDTANGGEGDDTLNGGNGLDRASYASATAGGCGRSDHTGSGPEYRRGRTGHPEQY